MSGVGARTAVVVTAGAVAVAAAVITPAVLSERADSGERTVAVAAPEAPGVVVPAHAATNAAPGEPKGEPTKDPRIRRTRTWMTVEPAAKKAPTVGIAYPLIVRFGEPVKRRGTVERRLRVTADGTPVVGAWSWRASDTVIFRPRHGFWPAKSRITLAADLSGTVLARNGAKKRKLVVGNKATTRTVSFKTARAFVARINDNTHQMVVRRTGKKVRTIPVSMGKPGFLTRSGIKVATNKYVVKRMVNQGLGYDVMSPYSVQITPTGEYIHGAPWAYGRIGRWNGSHGCVNLFVNDAKWYYDNVMLGDPVVTKNTGRPMEWTNGLGGPWNVPWKDWLAKSALKVVKG